MTYCLYIYQNSISFLNFKFIELLFVLVILNSCKFKIENESNQFVESKLNCCQLEIIDSIKLPFKGSVNIFNVSQFNSDILVYNYKNGTLYLIDSQGMVKHLYDIVGEGPDKVGDHLFYGDFIDSNSIVVSSYMGYTILNYNGQIKKRISISNSFHNSIGVMDVLKMNNRTVFIHEPIEDKLGMAAHISFNDRDFSNDNFIVKYDLKAEHSVEFVNLPTIDGTYNYWKKRSNFILINPHTVDKIKQKLYIIFSTYPKLITYNLNDLSQQNIIDLNPHVFTPFVNYSSSIKTLNGNSFFNEVVSTKDFILCGYVLKLEDENLDKLDNGAYSKRHFIIVDKKTNRILTEAITDPLIGYGFKYFNNNKIICTRNSHLIEDKNNDWLYVLQIK